MLSALRNPALRSSSLRSFTTSAARQWDVAKLTLVGTLVRDPEPRTTRYTVATQNYPPPQTDANGDRVPSTATFHRIVSFMEHPNKHLKTLRKGTKVYVEANFEMREPEPGADPATPRGQRQIFLKHEMIRVLANPWNPDRQGNQDESENF